MTIVLEEPNAIDNPINDIHLFLCVSYVHIHIQFRYPYHKQWAAWDSVAQSLIRAANHLDFMKGET